MSLFHPPFRILVSTLIPKETSQQLPLQVGNDGLYPIWRDDSIQHQSPFPDSLSTSLSYLPSILVLIAIVWTIIDPKSQWLPKRLSSFISTFSSFVKEDEIEQLENTSLDPTGIDADFNKGFKKQKKRVDWMILIALTQCIGWSFGLGWMIMTERRDRALTAGSSLFSWTFILFRLISKPPQTSSIFLLILFLILEVSILVSLFERIPIFLSRPFFQGLNLETIGEFVDLVLCSLEIALVLSAPIRAGGYEAVVPLDERIRQENEEIVPEQEDVQKGYDSCPTSPEDYTNLLSVFTYSWMNPIQTLSLKRSLLPTDIWKLRKINRVEILSAKFRDLRSRKSSLLTRVLTANAQDILKDILFKTTGVSLAYAGPALMKSILESIQAASNEDSNSSVDAKIPSWTPRQRAFVFACISLLLTLIRFISELLNFHAARQVGLRIRITLVVECFEKALRRRDLSGAVADGTKESGADLGKVVNIIANDINTLLRMGCDLHQLYGAPAEAIVATVLLYRILGEAALIGLSILIIAIPINYYLGNRNFKLQKAYSSSRDVRISLTNELLGSIKHLKLMGFQTQWREKVLAARENELKHLLFTRINGFMLNLFWSIVPILVSFTSFLYYVQVQKQELTVPVAFTSVTLFTLLRSPLNVIPNFFLLSLQALVSVRRLESFLEEEEVEEAISALSNKSLNPEHGQLWLENATFSWHGVSNSDVFQLKNISVKFPQSGLIVVAGPTSSGKSSLLSAILGEMKLESGAVRRDKFVDGKSSFSFAGQISWLEAGRSIKSNIVFTSAFDENRYRQVLEACALEEDLLEFEDGDETRVSSQTLSGGQKARIGFARALYASSHTLILDDIFAAVDTAVQRKLYDTLQGPLVRGRRVILVTHHLKLVLQSVDHLILLRRGEIEAQGSPADLQGRGLLKDLILEEEKFQVEVDTRSELKSTTIEGEGSRVSKGHSTKTKLKEDPKLLYELEKRREGSVDWSFWTLYISASSPLAWFGVVMFTIAMRTSTTSEQFWLKLWGEAYNRTKNLDWYLNLPPASGHELFYLNGLALIGLSTIAFQTVRLVFFYYGEMRASRSIYTRLLGAVTRAPLRFFNNTPQGRILQRFTGDMAVVDDELPTSTIGFLGNILALVTYLGVCLVITPAFVIPSLALFAFGPWYVRGFLASTRDMQRIESTSTSPMYSQFQEALEGISVIRAFGLEQVYLHRIIAITSATMSQWWTICTIEVWLSFRSQLAGGVAVFLVTLLALSGSVSVGSAGLVMTSAALLTQITYYVLNDFKRLNNNINSIERVSEFMDLEQEASSQALPPAAWPTSSGSIVVKNLTLRYAKDLPEVLKDLSFEIKPCEKIGIVGRTGSGKTSLASSFFRATELSSGSIWIDDVDISKIDLETLRRRLVLVAQDPVLFSGTIRSSLDPFDEYSDEEILRVLKQVQISGIISGDSLSLEDGSFLNSRVSAGGSNFSSGAAQLLSLSRALLRDARVVILDEATSSTDLETDTLIQKAIRSMNQSIVICVAHRLKTVIDYDRILVLEAGRIREFDTPANLLSKENGLFKAMCAASTEYEELRQAAGLS